MDKSNFKEQIKIDEKYLENGLSNDDVMKMNNIYGQNVILADKKINPLKILLAQFKDIMIIILLFSTAISFFMGEIIEAITIICIVIINALIGFFQEYRTEKTLDALKKMSSPVCKVIRDGKKQSIDTRLIVPGDVILCGAGDKVCADGFIISSNNLLADESILTGESLAAQKEDYTLIKSTDNIENLINSENKLNDKKRIYMGSNILNGNCKAIVTQTGMKSQMGQVANMLCSIKEDATPLQKKLSKMGKYIGIGCLIICFAVSVLGILKGEDVFTMLITGISLSVAAIPEGLPAIVTVSLALAVGRMVKKNAIVRKLHLVETLGCATVICSDKTGTLTENKMTVKNIFTYDSSINITGTGYEISGGFYDEMDNEKSINVLTNIDFKMLFDIALCCNESEISSENDLKSRNRQENVLSGSYDIFGNPTEASLLVMAAKASYYKKDALEKYEIINEIPFDSKRKMMSVLVKNKSTEKFLFAKGGAETIIEKCTHYYKNGKIFPLTIKIKKQFNEKIEERTKNGLRLLGFCFKKAGEAKKITINDEQNMIFVGCAAIRDMPRKEAFEAVKKCRRAGIKPVMITGDNKETARAIAKELKIYNDGDDILTGAELEKISDNVLKEKIKNVSVFARVSPADKLRIVKAFKVKGEVVAMTGDGVNDAPAIKQADIGIAMGISGTDVTKEASSMILSDDNFSTIVLAVEEGRIIYNNIRRFIRYLLSCNIGEVLTMFLSMMFNMPLVLRPIHILLINLVTDGLPAIALGLEPGEENIMNKKPRNPSSGIFSDGLLFKIISRGAIIGLCTIAAFISTVKITGDLLTAQSAAFYTLVLTQLIHSFECKSEDKSLFKINLLSNKKLLFAVLFSLVVTISVIFVPSLNVIFKTVPLPINVLFLITGYSFFGAVISAIFKKK